LTLAHSAALNALARDPSCAPAHRAAALTFAFARRDFNSANVHLDRAVALEPETRAVWRAQALALGAQGRLAPANAALDEAVAANPMSLSFAALKIQFLIMARAFDAAAQEVDRVLAIYPNSAPMKTARGWAMYFLGRREQSATAFRDSLMLTAAPQIAEGFDQALERAGLPGAFGFVHDLMAAPGLHRRPRETDLAFLAAAADMPEAATEHLKRAIDVGDPITHFAAFLPFLDPLRGRAPFEALVARMS
jgi:tetratricopeptide (TPR) repeat protein